MSKTKDALIDQMNKDADNDEIECTCENLDCREIACKGQCGCESCHNDYMDFLSCE